MKYNEYKANTNRKAPGQGSLEKLDKWELLHVIYATVGAAKILAILRATQHKCRSCQSLVDKIDDYKEEE